MRRKLSIFAIMLLLMMQSTPVGHISFATVEEDKHFDVQVDQQEENATIRVTAKEITYDTVSILLPAGSSYSEELTENQIEGLSYDTTNHSLTFDVYDEEKINIEFVLTNFDTPEQGLVVQGLTSGEKVIEETYEFMIDQQAEEPKEASVSEEVEPDIDSQSEENTENNDATEEKSSTNEKKVQPMVGDLNTDIDISPVNHTILSGENVLYKLSLKLTGSKRVYKSVDLVIDLPVSEHITFDDSDLSSLAINNVTPEFNRETDQLTYEFDEITRGQTYEKVIKLQTENGYILSGKEVRASASVSGNIHFTENDEAENVEQGDVVPFTFEDTANVTIEATSGVSVMKSIESPSNEVAKRGDEVTWQIEVDIPKSEIGQLFLKPGETIEITDQLPAHLTFGEMVEGETYTSFDNNLLTWEFSADDLEEQEMSDDKLFSKTLTFTTTVNNNAPEYNDLTNEATVQATFIDDEISTDDATKSVYISGGQPGAGDISGTIYYPAHHGPTNGDGGVAPSSDKNPVPEVYDDANLRFAFYSAPLRESRPSDRIHSDGNMVTGDKILDFKEYVIVYDVDENLNVETFTTPSDIYFRPTSDVEAEPFVDPPVFEILGVVDGVERTLLQAEDVNLGTTYTREQLGLLLGEKVSTLKVNFLYAPGGLQSYMWYVNFSVDTGYTGPIENHYNVIGEDGLGSPISKFDHRERYPATYENGNASELAGPRQATIIPRPTEAEPVGEVGVRLLEHEGGLVTPGTNRMQLNLTNINNSLAPMNEPLESVVLLPPGVQLSEEANPSYTNARGNDTTNGSYEVITDDYNGSGRQLVKVSWDDARMTKGQKVVAELDIDILENAPSHLMFDVYGFSSDANLLAPNYDDYVITNTILQTDEEDLNGDGVTDQPRLKSGNMYSMTSDYDLQTEKLIKGPNDEEFSKFTLARFDEIVEYKLLMTNTTGKEISSMTLIDVLPSVGDLGITDNINRGSTFEPILEGPITIPDEWEDKVNIFYSTAKNPERDDLTRYTDYPDSTTPLTNPEGAEVPNWVTAADVSDWNAIHSFKVELAQGSTWIKGQDIEIDFSMKMPSEIDVEDDVKNAELYPQQRAAWNSFAVATDAGQPVEPERVGVAIERFIDIPVEKVWEGEAQNEVTINLLADGEEVATVELSGANDWQHVFGDLPVANGIETIAYTIEEVAIAGYETNITGNADEGYVVTNTELMNISVEKVWEGAAQEGVIIHLLADGEEVATIELSGANDWQHVFEDLPVSTSDGAISYTVEEVQIDGYDTTITGSAAEGFVVTNTELTDISVEKVWEGEAQDEVTINLLADGEEVATVELSDANDWQHVFEDLPVANGEGPITYIVEEVSIDGYDTNITGSAEDGFVVTNTELMNIPVEKVWEGEAQEEVTINLLADGEEVATIELSGANDWQHVFEDLPVSTSDGAIFYMVEEVQIDGYDTTITGSAAEGFVVTNTLNPPETPDIEKEVEGNDGEFGKDLVEKEREKEYKYNVTTVIPEDVIGFEHVTLVDDLDERLDINGAVALVNGEEVDYVVTIEGQLVTLRVERDVLNDIAGQELTLQIAAQIKYGVEVAVIDNQATIQVNDHPKKNSNVVPVTPEDPPTTPEITKDVEGIDHIDIDYDKEYQYNVITNLPANIESYEKFIITDNVDQGLIVTADKVDVTVDGDVYEGLTLVVDGNDITVDVTDLAGLKGKEQIELVIPAKIHPNTNMDDYEDRLIPNIASLKYINEFGEEGDLETEPVTVTPIEQQLVEVQEKEDGDHLPKTATNTFNFILIGAVLMLIGMGTMFIRKRMLQ